MSDMTEIIERIAAASTEKGVLQERNRILAILVQYKHAGWLDDSMAHLLAQDICVEDR
jgi:hypothetical protein